MKRTEIGEHSATGWIHLAERLRSLALSLTRSAEAADELTQQTIARMFARAPDKLHEISYARRMMTRLWLDEQRSLRRRAQRLIRLSAHTRKSTDASEQLSQTEQVARVRDAVTRLPAMQQAVLVLRVMEELSYEQIAEAVGSSPQAVRANLHLARKRVREACGDE